MSSRSITLDSTGAIVQEVDYYAGVYPQRSRRGLERAFTDTLDNPDKFIGRERDPGSTLDYAIFRYHASRLGRFQTPDPLAGSPADPS